ncbi:MAG: DNA alkylation repair protein [Patescibacteria group bacterium]
MNLEKQIFDKLKPYCNKERAEHDLGYMNTKYELLGCNMPTVRQVAKEVYREVDNLDHRTRSKMIDEVWRSSNVFDVLYVCLIYFDNRRGKNDLGDWRLLKNWSIKIDNWGHSDQLSNIFADLLDRYPKQIYPMLQHWNKSKLPWQRRLSLVSLLGYASQRHQFLPVSKILPLVQFCLTDDHFYVQRAVGWTLRECGHIYPKEAKAFVKKYILELSPVAFTTATEKWDQKEKEPLKRVRKARRATGARRS